MKEHPWKPERPDHDEVVHEVKEAPDNEELWIIKMTKRSAKLTLFIGLLFSSDNLLPTRMIESVVEEFIFEGNELKRARTSSREFLVAPEHVHPRQLENGQIRIYTSPIIQQVKYYTLEAEEHEIEHYPYFSVHQYAYLMYLLLAFSLAQLTISISAFPRFGLWVFSIGCILAYALVYLSSTM